MQDGGICVAVAEKDLGRAAGGAGWGAHELRVWGHAADPRLAAPKCAKVEDGAEKIASVPVALLSDMNFISACCEANTTNQN